MTPEETANLVQLILSLVAVGGIGGVWFRLGALVATKEDHERRLNRLENHTWSKQ